MATKEIDMGKGGVPFVDGKFKVLYCPVCVERDGEEFKEYTCSYKLPATANKSQYYRNYVDKGECPNCHKPLPLFPELKRKEVKAK